MRDARSRPRAGKHGRPVQGEAPLKCAAEWHHRGPGPRVRRLAPLPPGLGAQCQRSHGNRMRCSRGSCCSLCPAVRAGPGGGRNRRAKPLAGGGSCIAELLGRRGGGRRPAAARSGKRGGGRPRCDRVGRGRGDGAAGCRTGGAHACDARAARGCRRGLCRPARRARGRGDAVERRGPGWLGSGCRGQRGIGKGSRWRGLRRVSRTRRGPHRGRKDHFRAGMGSGDSRANGQGDAARCSGVRLRSARPRARGRLGAGSRPGLVWRVRPPR
mmetsp:Transcript_16007/g.60520  ORF Transcript_16007/g.60520 Transcript_16007/m.60520 type:complete len:270 (+) Transcript_16007:363-1172(+)